MGPPQFLPPGWGDSSNVCHCHLRCVVMKLAGPGAHGPVAVPLPRDSSWGVPGQERGVHSSILLLTLLLPEKCLPPSPEHSRALGGYLRSVSPAALRVQAVPSVPGSPGAQRGLDDRLTGRWCGSGARAGSRPGAAGRGAGVLLVPCVVFPRVTQLS